MLHTGLVERLYVIQTITPAHKAQNKELRVIEAFRAACLPLSSFPLSGDL
jgi:hypothetical protein